MSSKIYMVEVTHTYLIDVTADSPGEAEDIAGDLVVDYDPTSYQVKVHGVGSWED